MERWVLERAQSPIYMEFPCKMVLEPLERAQSLIYIEFPCKRVFEPAQSPIYMEFHVKRLVKAPRIEHSLPGAKNGDFAKDIL